MIVIGHRLLLAALAPVLLGAAPPAQVPSSGEPPPQNRPSVIDQWEAPLRAALAGATSLRVLTVFGPDGLQPRLLFEDQDPASVAQLLAHLHIDTDRSTGTCACGGQEQFAFYRGDVLLAALGLHHGQGLRWRHGPWPADGELTPASAEFLARWIEQRGLRAAAVAWFAEVKERREQAARRRKQLLAHGFGGHRAAIPELLAVLQGQAPPAPPVPATPDELEAADRFHQREAASAALALGYLHFTPAWELLATRGDDVALALLGMPELLRPAHFRADPANRLDDPATRMAAVEAVVRCRGRFGLRMALESRGAGDGLEREREEDAVFQRLRDLLLAQDAPGRPLLQECVTLYELRYRWYPNHGEAYLQSLK